MIQKFKSALRFLTMTIRSIGIVLLFVSFFSGCSREKQTTLVDVKPLLTTSSSQTVPMWNDGIVSVSPQKPVTVNSKQTWTITFTTKKQKVSEGGSLLFIVTPFWGWSSPQTVDPAFEGYTTASCSNPKVQFSVTTPAENMVLIKILKNSYNPEDKLSICYGDTMNDKNPSAKARSDKYAETAPAFYLKVDQDGSGIFSLVRQAGTVTTISSSEFRIVAYGPTEVERGRQFQIGIAAVDADGNPNCQVKTDLHLRDTKENILKKIVLSKQNEGKTKVSMSFDRLGWHHVFIMDKETGTRYDVNPINCLETLPTLNLYWGDIHGHSSLSDGSGSVDDYFSYGRDVSFLDFCALTDHDFHGFKPLRGESWDIIRDAVNRYHQDNSFVVFLGYEWTSWTQGHRNVYYPKNQGEVFSHEYKNSDELPELWDLIKPFNAMTIPHHVAGGPIPADWRFHDPKFEWLVEISSVHGSSEIAGGPAYIYRPQPGCAVVDALNMGYRLGIMASGDSHDGHPGAHPRGSETRGLIAVRAPELNREAIWSTMQQRNVYATSGVRIYLEFTINGQTMGSQLVLSDNVDRKIKASAEGEQYLEGLVLIKNGDIIHRTAGNEYSAILEYTDTDPIGNNDYYYIRAQQMDGQLAWSSPIWISQ